MQSRHVGTALALIAVIVATGCTANDDGGDSDQRDTARAGGAVSFVAGGGGTEPDAEPVAAADARIAGPVTGLTESSDGDVWGIVDETGVLRVADGQISVVTPTLPDGSSPVLSDVAPTSDGTVYVTVVNPVAGEPAVYRLDDNGALVPGFGIAAGEDEMAAAAPVSPDGAAAADATLGPVVDLAVGDGGEVTFVEQVVPGGLQAANLVRRISEGELVTVAGSAPTPGEAPDEDAVIAAAFEDAATAQDLSVLGVASIAVDGPDTYLQVFNAVLRIDGDGGVTRILGSRSPEAERLPTAQGPFAEPLPGTDVNYRGSLDVGPSAANGQVLAMAIGSDLTDDQIASSAWDLHGGSDHAAEVATAAASAAEQEFGVLVDSDGGATLGSVIGTDALLTDEGAIIAAGWDFDSGEAVLVSYSADG